MSYQSAMHPILEAAALCGIWANGGGVLELAGKIEDAGFPESEDFSRRFLPFAQAVALLHGKVRPDEAILERYFRNLEGFPDNRIGSYSLGFLTLYPYLLFDLPADALFQKMAQSSESERVRGILLGLDVEGVEDHPSAGDYLRVIVDLDIPDGSRITLLRHLTRYERALEEIRPLLDAVIAALPFAEEQIAALRAPFEEELNAIGADRYLTGQSSLLSEARPSVLLRPFFFGPDTNLSLEPFQPSGAITIFAGCLRRPLQEILRAHKRDADRVFEMLKLIGDKTRFEILCLLREKELYGQEISDQFGLAKNTIHHHMTKLVNAGFVRCRIDGAKVYYSLAADHVSEAIEELASVFSAHT